MGNSLEKYGQTGHCPVRHILDRFGDKWSVLVLLVLGDQGVMRFGTLNQAIGDISQKMLTSTLRTLQADGLVQREAFAVIPPRVEYQLTPLGESLLPKIQSLTQWAVEHYETIRQSREGFAEALR